MALWTDRHAPSTPAEVPDSPAHLELSYPAQLSKGLVLVKSWLLAIPHYVVVALVAGCLAGPVALGLLGGRRCGDVARHRPA